MAELKPTDEGSKKDTIRITLPEGVTGRAGVPVPPGPPTQKLKPEDDQKKTPTPEMPRPTVRLRREEGSPASAPTPSGPIPVGARGSAAVSAAPSGLEIALAFAAIVISLGVVAFAAMTALN